MALGSLRDEATRLRTLLDELSEQDPVDQNKLDDTEADFIACQAEIMKKETEQAVTTGANSSKKNGGTSEDEDEENNWSNHVEVVPLPTVSGFY